MQWGGFGLPILAMPRAAPRYCTCGRHVVPAGQACPCAKARKAQSDASRPSARARGYDADHERARASHLKRHPNCVMCGQPGSVLDHIVSIRKAPERRLDPSNWQTLCHRCHGRKTAAVDGSFGRVNNEER